MASSDLRFNWWAFVFWYDAPTHHPGVFVLHPPPLPQSAQLSSLIPERPWKAGGRRISASHLSYQRLSDVCPSQSCGDLLSRDHHEPELWFQRLQARLPSVAGGDVHPWFLTSCTPHRHTRSRLPPVRHSHFLPASWATVCATGVIVAPSHLPETPSFYVDDRHPIPNACYQAQRYGAESLVHKQVRERISQVCGKITHVEQL